MCQTGGRRLHGVCWGEHGGSRRGADHRAGRALKLETWTLDLEKLELSMLILISCLCQMPNAKITI